MSEVANLHSRARQYLSERFQYWIGVYTTIDHRVTGADYSNTEKGIFPRYNVLRAILDDVERFVPEDFSDVNEERILLAESGRTASDSFSRPRGEIAVAAVSEERERFVQFVTSITDEELLTATVMPFRRTLSDVEVSDYLERLTRRWGLKDGAWYPLISGPEPKDVDVFHSESWRSDVVDTGLFSEILENSGSQQVIEIREYGASRQEDLRLLFPDYDGAEGLFTDLTLGWLTYASHESTITVGGESLRSALHKMWPAWVDARWSS